MADPKAGYLPRGDGDFAVSRWLSGETEFLYPSVEVDNNTDDDQPAANEASSVSLERPVTDAAPTTSSDRTVSTVTMVGKVTEKSLLREGKLPRHRTRERQKANQLPAAQGCRAPTMA